MPQRASWNSVRYALELAASRPQARSKILAQFVSRDANHVSAARRNAADPGFI